MCQVKYILHHISVKDIGKFSDDCPKPWRAENTNQTVTKYVLDSSLVYANKRNMNPFQVFKYSVLVILVVLFCTILFQSGLKYRKKITSYQKTSVNEDKLLYPSVSICKKYTFDDYIDEELLNRTFSMSEKQDLIQQNSWLRERVIIFLCHARRSVR